jgi:hypothetical protein
MQKLASMFQCKVLKLAKEGESFLQLQQGGTTGFFNGLCNGLFENYVVILLA